MNLCGTLRPAPAFVKTVCWLSSYRTPRPTSIATSVLNSPSTTAGNMSATTQPDVYNMGPNTLSVSRQRLHGKTRQKLLESMRKQMPKNEQGIILLMGGCGPHHYDTDIGPVFRQESYFHYLFGVGEPDWYGALDVKTGSSYLFMPHFPDSYAVWMGPLLSAAQYKEKYAVDEVHYVESMSEVLQSLNPVCLHLLLGKNSDSGLLSASADFQGIDGFAIDKNHLFRAIRESRVMKLPEEFEVMEYANKIASEGHVKVMQACKPGVFEYELESTFLHHCYSKGGARKPAYTPIAASGPNAAILHYGHEGCPNDRQLKEGELVLCDMGCKYYGYDSDITTTFPIGGKFNEKQKMVYETVLTACERIKQEMKPGISWLDMHILAEQTILEGLKDGGVLTGDVDDMLKNNLGGVFLPHGLGHLIGLDTHDVGGYPEDGPGRPNEPGRKSLRTARVLEEGMVLTVEPGCYFIRPLIEAALKNPNTACFFVKDVLEEFWGFGGVRIEDNVLVTSNGSSCLTNVPRSVEDVEKVMAGGTWA